MTQKVLRDVAASARQRLLNLARATERSFQLVLNRYAVERLLFRLSSSRYREQFVVKGATLFALWSEAIARPTRDLDLLGLREKDSEEVRAIFQELCRLAVPDDGLVFTADSVRVEPLRAGTDFEGLRVLLQATLAGARIPLQVDTGLETPSHLRRWRASFRLS